MKTYFQNLIVANVIINLFLVLSLDAKESPEQIFYNNCSACHIDLGNKKLSRISDQRKTPEGWFMSITRMQEHNALSLDESEKMTIIKYLSDTQGIAPNESDELRYILEQRPNIQEKPDDELFTQMCKRCHSGARIGLQRRNFEEWDKLVNFHLGHFPSTEYQALSRDREWLKIAKGKIVPFLAKKYPLNEQNWQKWQKQIPNIKVAGEWILHGHTLGSGDFWANLTLTKTQKDNYSLELKGAYLDGRPISSKGKAIVYSGYELRASLSVNDIPHKLVLAISENNKYIKGRMYETKHPEEGSLIQGLFKKSDNSNILAVYPKAIKTGQKAILTILGNNLSGKISLPKGIKTHKIINRNSDKITLEVYSDLNAKTANGDVKVGALTSKNSLAVYSQVDSIEIFPKYAIARVGDGGGKTPKQHAVFEAYGYSAGADKKIGTKDDIALGIVDVAWRVEPFDDIARKSEDIKFAGNIDSYSGRFMPSFAGLNPLREFNANNSGNLKVIATLKNSAKPIQAQSHLIVTIQKWVNPPIN